MTREERDAMRSVVDQYAADPTEYAGEYSELFDDVSVAVDLLDAADALDAAEARAGKAEADAAAMRAAHALLSLSCVPGEKPRIFCHLGSDGAALVEWRATVDAATSGTAGRALLDEVAALRAQVADLTRERDALAARRVEVCERCDGAGDVEYEGDGLRQRLTCGDCDGSGAVWVAGGVE